MEYRKHTLVADGCSLETTLMVVANDRRRALIRVLDRRGAPMSLAELSRAVTGDDPDLTPVGDGATAAVDVELHHHHLPKLDAAGVLEYEPDVRVVTAADTEPFVDVLESVDHDR